MHDHYTARPWLHFNWDAFDGGMLMQRTVLLAFGMPVRCCFTIRGASLYCCANVGAALVLLVQDQGVTFLWWYGVCLSNVGTPQTGRLLNGALGPHREKMSMPCASSQALNASWVDHHMGNLFVKASNAEEKQKFLLYVSVHVRQHEL